MVLPPELVSEILIWTSDFVLACKLGDKFAMNKLYDPKYTRFFAIIKGQIEMLKWLYINEKNDDYSCICAKSMCCQCYKPKPIWKCTACLRKCPCRYICTNNICMGKDLYYAVIFNKFSIVKWLIMKKVNKTNTIDCAVKYGTLKMVKWLHNNRTDTCTSNAISFAAQKGKIDIIEWLTIDRLKNYNIYAIYWEYKNQKSMIDKTNIKKVIKK